MVTTRTTEEISPEDKAVAEENVKANENLLKDKTEIDKLHDQANTESKDDIDEEFFSDLNPCE